MIFDRSRQQSPGGMPGRPARGARTSHNTKPIRALEFDVSGRAIRIWADDEGSTPGH